MKQALLLIVICGLVQGQVVKQKMVRGQPVKIEKTLLGVTYSQMGILIQSSSIRPVLYRYTWARGPALQSKYLGLGAWAAGLTGLGCIGYPVYKNLAEDEDIDSRLIAGGITALVSAMLLKLASQTTLIRAVELYNAQIKPVPDLGLRLTLRFQATKPRRDTKLTRSSAHTPKRVPTKYANGREKPRPTTPRLSPQTCTDKNGLKNISHGSARITTDIT